MRGEGGVACEVRVVGVPKSFLGQVHHLTNMNSDWMSNSSSGLRIIFGLYTYIFTRVVYSSWGVKTSIPAVSNGTSSISIEERVQEIQ